MRTLHWAYWSLPKPRAPQAPPMRQVRTLDSTLPMGHPRRPWTSPPALAATAMPDGTAALMTLPHPRQPGATQAASTPG